MCLESDSNRHYAVFETALSTVGVPRLTCINLNLSPAVGRIAAFSDRQVQRQQRHHPYGAHASHW